MNIIGQSKAIQYLTRGLQADRLSPSLLFVGPDGIGKKHLAMELAKCFSCLNPKSFSDSELIRCDTCNNCRRIEEGNHPDTVVIDRIYQAAQLKEKIETQTAIKVEMVRDLDKFLRLMPIESKRRTVIVDEAHRLNNIAANALLKVLEEPPNNAQIVLVALNEHTLPPTILSRCGVLRMAPLPIRQIALWLEMNHGLPMEIAYTVAQRSGGSFSKALQLKDEEQENISLSDYSPDEFFTLLQQSSWKKEGRKNSEKAITKLIETAQKKLEAGDISQTKTIERLLKARSQVDRNVSPRLVMEALFVNLEGKQ